MAKFVESLQQVDMSYLKMPMAVIYNSPRDFPDMCLCRIWEGANSRPTHIAIQRSTTYELREDIKAAGFTVCLPRAAGDDPVIVETWMK